MRTVHRPKVNLQPPRNPTKRRLSRLQSETDEEVDTAHVCFMANDNTPKVIPEPSLDDCDLTMDKLGEAFEVLSNNYDFLKKKYLKMKFYKSIDCCFQGKRNFIFFSSKDSKRF